MKPQFSILPNSYQLQNLLRQILFKTMSQAQEQFVPPLLPLEKAKKDTSPQIGPEQDISRKAIQPVNISINQGIKMETKASNRRPKQRNNIDIFNETENQSLTSKIQDFDARFKLNMEKAVKKESKQTFKNTNKSKDIERSKKLIGQMLSKINTKNITEEAFPVTHQTIGDLIDKLDEEISSITRQQQRTNNSLALNPNNVHLKRQLQSIKSSLQKTNTIKDLYKDKINQRNKIMALQQTVVKLKDENANLKIKINRGIETIQNHMHNLPCQKEKKLKQQLDRVHDNWIREKEMRQNLENSISVMVINFKRIFEEAEMARRIIVNQLKQIHIKQKRLALATLEQSAQKGERNITPELSVLDDKAKRSQKITDIKDYFPSSSQRTPPKISNARKDTSSIQIREIERHSTSMFSMQQQIKKMRNNQLTMKKYRY